VQLLDHELADVLVPSHTGIIMQMVLAINH
jgi:hypothetical protein